VVDLLHLTAIVFDVFQLAGFSYQRVRPLVFSRQKLLAVKATRVKRGIGHDLPGRLSVRSSRRRYSSSEPPDPSKKSSTKLVLLAVSASATLRCVLQKNGLFTAFNLPRFSSRSEHVITVV